MIGNDKIFKKYTTEDTFKRIIDFNSFNDMLTNSVNNYPNNYALITDSEKVTYIKLNEMVAKFRTVLKNYGFKKGQNVGIFMQNSIDFVKVYLSLVTLGIVAVLLPTFLTNDGLISFAKKYKLEGIVCDDIQFSKFSNDLIDIKIINAAENSEILSSEEKCDANAPSTIVFTGGTTGAIKGSVLSSKAILNGAKNGCYGYYDVFEQRYLLVLPLTHVFGLIRNLLTSLYTGSSLFICTNTKDLFKNADYFQPTIIVLVPALAEMALSLSKQFKRNMLGSSLKYIICGAAFVPPYLINEYKKLGVTLFPGYGLTESANLVSGNAESISKPNSVGFLYPDVEAKIVNEELWIKGPNMQNGYYDNEENESSYENGWFKTGDLAHFDEDGLLYITGRKKEIIVLSTGENVSPAELEALFSKIDLIQDCLVYENEQGLLELEVLIRTNIINNNPKESIKNEVNKINENLPSFKKISNVVFREKDFIRSSNMKIIRSKNGYNKNNNIK